MNEVILAVPISENNQRTEMFPGLCLLEALSGRTSGASAAAGLQSAGTCGLSHSSPLLLEAESSTPLPTVRLRSLPKFLSSPAGPGHQAAENGSTTVTTDNCHSSLPDSNSQWICHSIHTFKICIEVFNTYKICIHVSF